MKILKEKQEKANKEIETLKDIYNHDLDFPTTNGFTVLSLDYNADNPLILNGTTYKQGNTRAMGFSVVSEQVVCFQIRSNYIFL